MAIRSRAGAEQSGRQRLSPAGGEPARHHVVRSGDTLSALALRYGVSLQALIEANKQNIPDPDKIFVGDQVIIPAPAREPATAATRQAGDTAAAGEPTQADAATAAAAQLQRQRADALEAAAPKQAKLAARDAAPAADARLDTQQAVGLTGLLAQNRRAQEPAAGAAPAPLPQPQSPQQRQARIAELFAADGVRRLTERGFAVEQRGLIKSGAIEGEAIVLRGAHGGRDERFYRLQLKGFEDSLTNHDELRRTERFVSALDGEVAQRRVDNDDPGWWNRNVNPATHGATEVDADIYLSAAAKTKICQASREEAIGAYARATQQLEGLDRTPAWASPDLKLRAEARRILDRYDATGTSEGGDSNADYHRLTGRNAWADQDHYRRAKAFAGFVTSARGGDDPAFLQGFAKLAKRGDFMTSVAAMNELSPEDPLLLNKLELSGERARISAHSKAGAVPESQSAAVDKVFKLRSGEVSERQLVNTHPFASDNKVELLVDGTRAFPEMFKAIESAKESINVSFYIINDDELGKRFADTLIAKAQQGVEVNLMVDGVGSVQVPGSSRRDIIDRMERGGVKVIRNHMFNPTSSAQLLNHPDHRKLVIVDGKTAFTGGMNIGDHYIDQYHDIMIKVQGTAVQQMQAEWLTSWMHLGGEIDRSGGTPLQVRDRFFPEPEAPAGAMKARVLQAIPGENREIFDNYLALIDGAERSIQIENPYCTNPEIQQALVRAAKRGVDVTVILPGESDHGFSHLAAKAKYPEMLDAGVKIYEYPGFNHGKIMVVDGSKTTVGSSNLDDVALRHIYELNVLVDDADFARQASDQIFKVDLAKSKQMKKEEITGLDRVTGSFFNLFHDII